MLVPPMTMMDFFQKSEGVWLIHRTVHHFDSVADESGESKIHVKVVAKEDDRVQKISASQDVDLDLVSCGASFIWQAHEEGGA
ncbi:phycoerythrin linker protein CpeS homolog [Pseudanabaena sp. lw0831]|nr:phycoerythrin linker protein CpeS homolog [Pseudanabaena sp. lw0831]